MRNLVSATAGVASDKGGEKGLDDVHFFVGEECSGGFYLQLLSVLFTFQWIRLCRPIFNIGASTEIIERKWINF